MSQQVAPSPAGKAMDYREHDRTYDGFLQVAKILSFFTGTIVLALAIFGFGGFWLGVIVVIAALAAAAIGLAAGRSDKPPLVVFVVSFVLMALSVV